MAVERDRRSPYRPEGPVEITCRVCFRHVVLDEANVFEVEEYGERYWAFRCPECGGSFPVREDDAPHSTA